MGWRSRKRDKVTGMWERWNTKRGYGKKKEKLGERERNKKWGNGMAIPTHFLWGLPVIIDSAKNSSK